MPRNRPTPAPMAYFRFLGMVLMMYSRTGVTDSNGASFELLLEAGGPDKAVYAYAEEDYVFWKEAEGLAVTPGLFGENLTVRGLELRDAVVGERWRIGTAVLEVAQPRLPCYKLGIRMGDDEFPGRSESVGRMGAYLRIINEGVVAPGDLVEVIERPEHGVTLREMIEALGDRERLRGLLRAPGLPAYWRRS